jgi:hypothetical protein
MSTLLFPAISQDLPDDIPSPHWASGAIKKLIKSRIISPYPDNTYKGDEALSRYEAATILARILSKIEENTEIAESLSGGVSPEDISALRRLIYEFEDELRNLGYKVDDVFQKFTIFEKKFAIIDSQLKTLNMKTRKRVSVGGDIRVRTEYTRHENDAEGNDFEGWERIGINIKSTITPDISGYLRMEQNYLWGQHSNAIRTTIDVPQVEDGFNNQYINFAKAYIDVKNILRTDMSTRLGRQFVGFGHNLFFAEDLDGIMLNKRFKKHDVGVYLFDTDSIYDGLYNNVQYDSNNKPVYNRESETDGMNFTALKWGYDISLNHHLELYTVSDKISTFNEGNAYAETFKTNLKGFPDTINPNWTGIAVDGKLCENTDYNLEFVRLNSDIQQYIDKYKEFNMWDDDWKVSTTSDAWVIGIQSQINRKTKMLLQYGAGDEEFLAYAIKHEVRLNGMEGNMPARKEAYASFTGVKDFITRLSHQFDNRKSAYIQYERVMANDTSNILPNSHEYDLLRSKFFYRIKNSSFSLTWDYIQYDDQNINNMTEIADVNAPDANEQAKNSQLLHTLGGGRNMIRGEYIIAF